MYAEGLVKILNAILNVRKVGVANDLSHLEKEEATLSLIITVLSNFPNLTALEAAKEDLYVVRKEINRSISIREQSRTINLQLELLKKCKIKPEDYEEKFRLISADVPRISHGSVKPPAWEAA